MNSRDLTPDQCRQVMERIRPALHYLGNLERRMEARDFPREDKLFQCVAEVHRQIGELYMNLHYQACMPGMIER